MVEIILSSNSTKIWDQARIKLVASGSTIRFTTDCPSGPCNTCTVCTKRNANYAYSLITRAPLKIIICYLYDTYIVVRGREFDPGPVPYFRGDGS